MADPQWLRDNAAKLNIANASVFEEFADDFEQLQAENKRLKEEARWIPVSKRLPKLDKKSRDGVLQSKWVLVTDGERWVEAYYYDYTKREAKPNYATGKGWYCHQLSRNKITHWKPIILPDQALQETK